jgi:hypothetical protein
MQLFVRMARVTVLAAHVPRMYIVDGGDESDRADLTCLAAGI